MSDTPDDNSLPLDPVTRDDEMDDERYEYPPGIMPSSGCTYSFLQGDGVIIVYTEGELSSEFIKMNDMRLIHR